MAQLTVNQVYVAYQDGNCGRTALYALKNVTAGDTFDAAAQFATIRRGGLINETGSTIAAITFTGTVVTIPAGPAADAVWVLLVGVAGA